jgi:KDO2-lipid IV(A) lauroyltransferase
MYLGFLGLRTLAQALPERAAAALGRSIGRAAYQLLGTHRRLTHAHLEQALGDTVSAPERARIAQGVFVNLGRNAVEWLRLPRLSPARLQALVEAQGLEHLRQALAGGRGAIVITAHFGNWELIPLYLRTLGFEGGVLARPLRYPEYELFLVSLRRRRGVATFARGSVKDVARALRANQIIGLLPDQDVDSLEGIFVPFFGRPAYTPVGPAALALMTGAPIVPCFLLRQGRGFRLVIEPPLAAPAADGRPEALRALTEDWSRVVESYVRRYPDHWAWMHRRWKTAPPEASAAAAPRPGAALSLTLSAACGLLLAVMVGCGRSGTGPKGAAGAAPGQEAMSEFTLVRHEVDGAKRWELQGHGATADGRVVTILQPDGVGYDIGRTAHLTASAAQMHQDTRHVRLEHDVTIHTSDGLWFSAPVLHWIPDQDQMATDTPVRIETDHMLLRGRGARGLAQLKHATLFEDIEMVLNPTEEQPLSGRTGHVVITCDGPLAFDYEHHIATFEQNVHVQDANGDLYSDRLIAYLNPQTRTIRYAEAIGNVRIVQHQNTARSTRAVYEPLKGKITLVGRPSLLVFPEEKRGPTMAFGGLPAAPAPAAQGTP